MDLYTLTNPVAGTDTVVKDLNSLAINVERLLAYTEVTGALYINYTISIDPTSYAPVNFDQDLNILGITINSKFYDDSNILDPSTRVDFKIPIGYTRAKFYGYSTIRDTATVKDALTFYKNGSADFLGNSVRAPGDGLSQLLAVGSPSLIRTPWLQVKPFDSFELVIVNTSATQSDHETISYLAVELRR